MTSHGRKGHRQDEAAYQHDCFIRWLASLPLHDRNAVINRMYMKKTADYVNNIETAVANELIRKRKEKNK